MIYRAFFALVITVSGSMITNQTSALAAGVGPVDVPKVTPPRVTPPKVPSPKVKTPKTALPELTQEVEQTLVQTAERANLQLPVVGTVVDLQGNPLFNEVEIEPGVRVIQHEWIGVINAKQQQHLKQLPIQIIATRDLSALGLITVRFKTKPELDSKDALEQVLPKGLMQKLERHHVYSSQTAKTSLNSSASALQSAKLRCNSPVKIGLLDTAIDQQHPAFKQQKIKAQNFVIEGAVTPKNHATAVAGVLIGNQEQLKPRLSKAELYSAEVFYARNDYSQGAALDALLQGLNWLASQNIPVINMSLTGPHNDILELAIKQLSKQKIALVAAAGNNGPAAPAAYPAAYKEVIAVTAVDEKGDIYRWANQGDYIDFAAHGVSVLTTQSPDKVGYESGTSLAAPVIAAAIGCGISEGKSLIDIVNRLKKDAKDLGAKGKDPVFGYGWLGY